MEMAIELVLIALLSAFIFTFLPTFFTGAPFAPTKKSGLPSIISLAAIKSGEKAIDIGSGDGRLVFALAFAGAESYGIEINPFLVIWSKLRTPKKLKEHIHILRGSTWMHDFSKYSAVTVFGIPYIMKKLEEKLQKELQPGARIVVNRYPFPTWKPTSQQGKLYLYVKE
jgi:precorrin-6B methylase 2